MVWVLGLILDANVLTQLSLYWRFSSLQYVKQQLNKAQRENEGVLEYEVE